MADCPNVEIRELLPERAGGALSAADMARVDAHLGSCELCTAELLLIQAARRALRISPTMNLARITASVVSATAAPSRPQLVTSGNRPATAGRRSRLSWVGWKAAAAIAIAAAGAGSFAVWSTTSDRDVRPNGVVVAAALPAVPGATATVPEPAAPSPSQPVVVASARPVAAAPAELEPGGGLGDLSEADLQTLLGDIGSAGSAIVADPSFDEPDVAEPALGTVADGEST